MATRFLKVATRKALNIVIEKHSEWILAKKKEKKDKNGKNSLSQVS